MKNLIFIHGGPGYNDYLEKFFKNEFLDSINTIFYTQLQSDKISIKDLIHQLSDIVNSLKGEIYILGHSWGGFLAVEFLHQIQNPNIQGLIFVNAVFSFEQLDIVFKNELSERKINNPNLEDLFFTKNELACCQELAHFLRNNFSELTYQKVIDNTILKLDLAPIVHSLTIPMLNIVGSDDLRVPSKYSLDHSKLNYRITNFVVKEAGHFPFALSQNKTLIIQEIQRFLFSDHSHAKSFTLREADINDLDIICKLGYQTFVDTYQVIIPQRLEISKAYALESFANLKIKTELLDSKVKYFLLFEGQNCIGYAKLNWPEVSSGVKNKSAVELERFYLTQSSVGKGIGKYFFSLLKKYCEQNNVKSIWLGVFEENQQAIQFYEKIGFKLIGRKEFAFNWQDIDYRDIDLLYELDLT